MIAAMATELNRALLAEAGFPCRGDGPTTWWSPCGPTATPRGRGGGGRGRAGAGRAPASAPAAPADRPRTVESAAARAPGAGVVVVSVPGPHAYVEAMAALRAGRHVMVFSDGVDLAAEVALKREATARGRLVMGPDCGTAILGGVGLGFANVVVPGPVGLVAASGTGAQQLCGLLDGAGIGVRHVIGVGGRRPVGRRGRRVGRWRRWPALDADPAVEVIAVVSKPPDPEVAEAVAAAAAAAADAGRAGPGRPGPPDAHRAPPRSPPPGIAVRRAAVVAPAGDRAPARPGPVLGLFSGGTNCRGGAGRPGGAPRPGALERPPRPGRRIGPPTPAGGATSCSTWATTS